jgi:cytochrome c-type biogenesis protein CcmF
VLAFTESDIGPWLLEFFGLTVALTLALIAWRGDRLRAPGHIDSPLSREAAFLMNNVVFAVFAAFVLVGTVWPLVVEAVNDDRISVGVPYFNRMATPLGLVLLFLMAVAPVLPWRSSNATALSQRLHWPAWGGTVAVLFALAVGARGLAPLLAFGFGGFAAGAALRQVALATRRQGWRGLVGRANGGMVVHLGVVMVAVALAASSSYDREAELTLSRGESARAAGHELTYLGTETERQENKTVIRARVRVDGDRVFEPALNRFDFGETGIGTPSVRSTLRQDVYLALLDLPDGADGQVVLRVIVQPLVVWLWIGGGVMLVGTVLAAFPGRRRQPTAPVSVATATTGSQARTGSQEDAIPVSQLPVGGPGS